MTPYDHWLDGHDCAHDPRSPAYDNTRDDELVQDAIAQVEARMSKRFEFGELLSDLYDNGYAYGALDRLLSRTPAMGGLPGDDATLQSLLRTLKYVHDAVEAEIEQ